MPRRCHPGHDALRIIWSRSNKLPHAIHLCVCVNQTLQIRNSPHIRINYAEGIAKSSKFSERTPRNVARRNNRRKSDGDRFPCYCCVCMWAYMFLVDPISARQRAPSNYATLNHIKAYAGFVIAIMPLLLLCVCFCVWEIKKHWCDCTNSTRSRWACFRVIGKYGSGLSGTVCVVVI